MTEKEAAQLVALALSNLPGMQDRQMKPTIMLWQKMFSDLPYELAEAALIKVLSTTKFWPTVAEIREAAAQISQPKVLEASEAWGQVMEGLRKFGLYQAQDAMNWFSPEIRMMVKRFGWWEICHTDNIDVVRGQFIKAWDAHAKGQREMAVLPGPIREMIEGMAEAKALPRGKH